MVGRPCWSGICPCSAVFRTVALFDAFILASVRDRSETGPGFAVWLARRMRRIAASLAGITHALELRAAV
jgi:hypothetical protein